MANDRDWWHPHGDMVRLWMVAWPTIRRFGLKPGKSGLSLRSVRSLALQASIEWQDDVATNRRAPPLMTRKDTEPCVHRTAVRERNQTCRIAEEHERRVVGWLRIEGSF